MVRFVFGFLIFFSLTSLACAADSPMLKVDRLIGYDHITLTDTLRAKTIPVTIYYPIAQTYEPNIEADAFIHSEYVNHVPIRDRWAHPMIIISPDFGRNETTLSWLADALASNGYLVATIDHKDKKANANNEQDFYMERTKDVSFVLDKLLDSRNSKFVDANKIGMIGLSTGSSTAMLLIGATQNMLNLQADPNTEAPNRPQMDAYVDARIKATFLMSPEQEIHFDQRSLNQIKTPTFIMDIMGPRNNAHRKHTLYMAEQLPRASLKFISRTPNAFIFEGVMKPENLKTLKAREKRRYIDGPNINRKEIHNQIAQEALGFFSQHFRPKKQP